MGVVSGKLGKGFKEWWGFRKDADIEADANHIELYMEAGFFKGVAMLFEEVARYLGFPSSGAACTWTGNSTIIPANQQGHNYSLVERRFYP